MFAGKWSLKVQWGRTTQWHRTMQRFRVIATIMTFVLVSIIVSLVHAGPFDLSLEEELEIGKMVRAKILSTHVIHTKASAYLARIGRRLLSAGPWPQQFAHTYSFYVVEDPNNPELLNAFCAPGGFICFYRALFEDLLNNYGEDAVAAVLAHEIEHANNHHVARQVKRDRERGLWAQLGAAILTGILGGGERTFEILSGLADIYTNLQSLKYSRDLEDEADERGIVRLYRAGYNPKAMAEVFNYLKHRSGAKVPEYLSTHPPEEERIKRSESRASILETWKLTQTLSEVSVVREGKKVWIQCGWLHGLRKGMKLRIEGKTFKVGNVYFDRAEIDAKEKDLKDLPERTNAIVLDPPASDYAQPVGVGTVTAVDENNQLVTIDLGSWHLIKEGMVFLIYAWRFEEKVTYRGMSFTTIVPRVIAEAVVKEVREKESVLKVEKFRTNIEKPGERFTFKDIQVGDEVRWRDWLMPKPIGK